MIKFRVTGLSTPKILQLFVEIDSKMVEGGGG